MAFNSPHGLIAMAVVLEVLTFTAVVLRFISRHQRKAGYRADDWLIVVGYLFATALCVIEIYGAATNAYAVPLNATIADASSANRRFKITRHLELSIFLLGVPGLTFIKLSVVFLYRRVFSGRGWFGTVTLVWIVIIAVWGVAFTIASFLECGSHLTALFSTPEAFRERCGNAVPIGEVMTASDAITDLVTLLLPIPMVYNIKCPLRRKIGIIAVFAIGLFSVAASAAKAGIYISTSLDLYHPDAIILFTEISVLNYVEVMVGIIAACAVTFRPIFSEVKASSSVAHLLSYTKRLSKVSQQNSYSESEHAIMEIRHTVKTDNVNDTRSNDILVHRTYDVCEEFEKAEAGLSNHWTRF